MNQRFIDYFIYNNNTFEITKLEDVDLSVIIEESEFVNTSFNIDFYNSHNKNDDDDEQTDTASEGENEKNICLLENLGTFSNDFLKFPIFDDVSIQNSNLQEQIAIFVHKMP
ncbi:hypothetical protein PVAND_001726 [Polypedilum vanderplanki]|uniref:Uncharacterized protein n=1 Tax=Polypedilum vanderplanki TaxID=319348 RepID=A0A9J6BNT8_POLVA|nr:hypothetical protein PVAND_001726 [Polypedilum vanderplanki]